MTSNLIPKKLGHIWIGPLSPPLEWMNSWPNLHPDWDYQVYDNAFLLNEAFETQAQIDEYIKRGAYAGAADLIRYETLYRYGGFIAEADSVCLRNIDGLLTSGHSIYTVYENEFVRGELVSPILASTPGHPFLRLLIDEIKNISPAQLDTPWKQTGNLFVAMMIKLHQPAIKIWPSHYLIPQHHTGVGYEGSDEIYAEQFFGTTNKMYKAPNRSTALLERQRKLYKKIRKKMQKLL